MGLTDRMPGVQCAVLFVQYDTLKYRGAFERFRALVDRIRFCTKTYFVVDNRHENSSVEQMDDGVVRVGGDDTDREFSGWRRGLEALRETGARHQVILVANDAVFAPGPLYLRDYGTVSLWKSFIRHAIVGRIDSHGGGNYYVMGAEIKNWICTNCFFVPSGVMNAVGNIVTIDNNGLDAFIDRHYRGEFFKKDAPISEPYRRFIIEWLTRRWRSGFVIGPETWNDYRQKVKAMLNEALFTARVREKGFGVLSYGSRLYY